MPKSDKRKAIKLDLAIGSSGRSNIPGYTLQILHMVGSASLVSSAISWKEDFSHMNHCLEAQ